MDTQLSGKTAIVTGAGQGIGLGIAHCLAAVGANVVIADVLGGRVGTAVDQVTDASPGANVIGMETDVTRVDSVGQLIDETQSTFGGLDILVNNAGVVIVKAVDDQTESDWDRVLDVNLKGSYLCAHQAIPALTASQGCIINLCSISAYGFTTPHVPYSASKAGIIGLTRDLAVELGGRGVRVNAIAPGPIETPMFDSLTPEQKAAHAAKVPLGRLGQPSDIGQAVVFLASDSASFITGAVIPVTGGSDLKFS